jgi:hypothetical protein
LGRKQALLRDLPRLFSNADNYDSVNLARLGQVGDAFQREHPNIPVVLNHGRHLVIAFTSTAGKKVGVGNRICWQLQPLPRNKTIVEVIDKTAAKRAVQSRIHSLVPRVESNFMVGFWENGAWPILLPSPLLSATAMSRFCRGGPVRCR